MIELYELRQFAAFAGCGTLSDAAKLLHLSQPALSRNSWRKNWELHCLPAQKTGWSSMKTGSMRCS